MTRLFIVALTLAVWWPLLSSPLLWTVYDEVERTAFLELENWQVAWEADRIRSEDPISLSSYFWEQSLPLSPSTAHRAINLSLHLLSVLLLLAILESLRVRHAWVAALLFAVHPSAAQALFWAGYRPVLLGTALILSALFLGIRNRNGRDYGIALALSATACLVHPAAYALPVLLALAITLKEFPPRLGNYNRVLPFLFVVLAVTLATSERGWNSSVDETDAFARTLNEGGLNLIFYLQQAAIPFDPALFYPPAIVREGEYRGDTFLSFVFLLPSVVLIVIFFRRGWARALLLGLGSFLLLAAPELFTAGLSPGGQRAFETNGLYPALPAAAALFTAGTGFLLRKLGRIRVLIWPSTAVLPIAAFAAVSITFARDLRNEETIWRDLARTFPGDIAAKEAHVRDLLKHPETVPDPEDIAALTNQVLAVKPSEIGLRMQLARLYRKMDQPTNAVREYRRTLRESEPDSEFLREAADYFDSVGLNFDARNARDRISDL